MKKIVITIDGPAASGKSTISKLVADKLNIDHLSTGIFYRALAYFIVRKGLSIEEFLDIIDHLNIDIVFPNSVKVEELIIDKSLLNDSVISQFASQIAKDERVRDYLLGIQRKVISGGNIVADGRDVGTVVYPNADFKFFLTASSDERARRRLLDLGLGLDKFFEIRKEIEERDKRDKLREIAPLIPAYDAYIIYSTYRTKEEVVDIILSIIDGS